MIEIGDVLVLKKPFGFAKNIGEEFVVTCVIDDLVGFEFSMGTGGIGMDSLEEYFDVKKKKKPVSRITESMVQKLIDNSQQKTETLFDKCTVVTIQLPNGYVISEYSACVYPEDYDRDLGYRICMKKLKEKIFELEAYKLQSELNPEQKAVSDW